MMDSDLKAMILAGGKSSRMGSDKSLMELGGKPLIEHVVEALRPYVSSIVVVTNDQEKYGFLKDVDFVQDFRKGEGPLVGIISGLEATSGEWFFVTSCDMPLIDGGILEYLADIGSEGTLVVSPFSDGFYEPMLSLYHKDVLPFALSFLESYGRSVGGFIRQLDSFGLVHTISMEQLVARFGEDCFINVNDREVFEMLKDGFCG